MSKRVLGVILVFSTYYLDKNCDVFDVTLCSTNTVRDVIGSCKSNYHTITSTSGPLKQRDKTIYFERMIYIYILVYKLISFKIFKIAQYFVNKCWHCRMSDEHQQHLCNRLKYVSMNNWNYTEYIPVVPNPTTPLGKYMYSNP